MSSNNFIVKDSWVRQEFQSWMKRDTQEWKPRYDLIERSMLKRLAIHLAKWAEKYGDNNWKLADSPEELARFHSSAMRHFMQWMDGEVDEDHASAVLFNVIAVEFVKEKINSKVADVMRNGRKLSEYNHQMMYGDNRCESDKNKVYEGK